MKTIRLACAVLLALPVLTAQAAVYRYVDKSGNVVFTDSPPEGAEKVQTRPVMTIPAPPKGAVQGGQAGGAPTKKLAVKEYVITLQNPAPEAVFRRGEGEVPVAISVSPSLVDGHRLEMLLDGKEWSGSSIPLDDTIDRGAHTLTAQVLDAKGNVLSATSVTFHVQQPSVLAPAAP